MLSLRKISSPGKHLNQVMGVGGEAVTGRVFLISAVSGTHRIGRGTYPLWIPRHTCTILQSCSDRCVEKHTTTERFDSLAYRAKKPTVMSCLGILLILLGL